VSLTHATTVRWDHVVGWTGHVIGAPSSQVDADGRTLARFAGNGSLLLAMHDEAAPGALASYGRCEVIRRLGGGPRDEILLARSVGPGGFRRKVVLERRLVGGDDGRPIERLAREAHAYALLTHAAIARLFDFLLIDGHPVIVREYVSGVSLAELVTAASDRDGEVQASIALYVAHGVFSALAAAHEAFEPDTGDVVPLVHGDVRPGCVLVGWNGDVKVAGFAAARLDGGRPPTMKSDVRAAARLLLDMLGPRSAVDFARGSEAELRDAVARAPLGLVRTEQRGALRDGLLAALLPRNGGAPRARELADVIAAGTELDLARELCLDVLGVLRERQGGAALSSMPPPVVVDDTNDSRFFHRPQLPKPSPVPALDANGDIVDASEPRPLEGLADLLEPEPAPAPPEPPRAEPPPRTPTSSDAPLDIESYATPPPVQPPSMDPGARASTMPLTSARRRRFATAIAAGVVALASGIASIDGARSAQGPEAPSPPVAAAAPIAREPVEAPVPAPPVASEAPAAPAVSEIPATADAMTLPADRGVLRAPLRARQHRIFLDGHVIGEGSGDYVIPCGAHTVRMGSQGSERRIDVPCGGTFEL
jgi:hypothetical protein